MERHGEWLHMTVPENWSGITIANVMKNKWKVPRKLRHDFRSNEKVLLNGSPPHWKTAPVRSGDILSLNFFQHEDFTLPEFEMELDVLYEDDHVLVVNKPAGMFTHPNGAADIQQTLWNGIAFYCRKQQLPVLPKYIHRLDRHTSGAVLFGKHALATAILGEMMKNRRISRAYAAKVHGHVENDNGRVEAPIAKDPAHPVKRMVDEDGQPAITNYHIVQRGQDHTLLSLKLDSGRTHQIRVHLSHLGHPLLGDDLYGGQGDVLGRQSLHAAALSFPHPFTGEIITCAASSETTPFFTEKELRSF